MNVDKYPHRCSVDCAEGVERIERAHAEGQKRWHSIVEAWTNVLVGLGVSMTANALLFPLFGWTITHGQNLGLAGIFTVISLCRSYVLRRLFNRWHVRDARR